MKKILPLSILFLTALSAGAQTLDELFLIADQHAKPIRISHHALSAAQESVAKAKAQRLPEIGASLSVGYNGRGLITDRNFSNPTNIYIPEFANNFSLQVSQVLYAGGAVSNSIKLSELGQQMAELDIEKNRQEVRFYIAGQYLDMMKAQSTLCVVDQNIALTEQLIGNMKARVAQGAALQNDVTRYELQLENLRLQRTQLADALSIMNHALCQTLSLPEGTEIRLVTVPDDSAAIPEMSHNPVLRQAALATEMADKKLALSRAAQLPKLAFVAEDHLNGPVTIEIPALNKNFNCWFVGLGIQYDLSALYKNKPDLRRAHHEKAQSVEQLSLVQEQISTAVHAAQTNLQTACTELRTCEKQVQLAAENFSVVQNRYNNGLALITDLLDASNMKLSAEIAREQARINIVYHQKKLAYLAGTL